MTATLKHAARALGTAALKLGGGREAQEEAKIYSQSILPKASPSLSISSASVQLAGEGPAFPFPLMDEDGSARGFGIGTAGPGASCWRAAGPLDREGPATMVEGGEALSTKASTPATYSA